MQGRVIKLADDKAELLLFCAETKRKEVKDGHCGFCNLATKKNPESETVIAENRIGAKVGDVVELRLKDGGELKSAVILLMLPLGIFILTLSLADGLQLPLWASGLLGALALAVTYTGLKIVFKNKTYYYLGGEE